MGFLVSSRCHRSSVSAAFPLRIFPSVSGSALLTPEVDTRLAWPISTSSHFDTDIGQVGSGPSGANESLLQPCPCLWTYSLQGDGHLCLPSRDSRSDGGQSELRDGERGSTRPMGSRRASWNNQPLKHSQQEPIDPPFSLSYFKLDFSLNAKKPWLLHPVLLSRAENVSVPTCTVVVVNPGYAPGSPVGLWKLQSLSPSPGDPNSTGGRLGILLS